MIKNLNIRGSSTIPGKTLIESCHAMTIKIDHQTRVSAVLENH